MKTTILKIAITLIFIGVTCSLNAKKGKTTDKNTGYLFVYFEGQSGTREQQEQIRFAYSKDAVNWYALNYNKPVIGSDSISKSGGIRDPHILRGHDGKSFYIVATDMSTAKNGWGPNPGIVLLKSENLINWNHHFIDFPTSYPEKFANVNWVWAPQSIYDESNDKYLIYFTIKHKNDLNLDFYCGYASKNFDKFEETPDFMYRPKFGAIDGDIIYKDGTYHLFYKGNSKDENGKEFESGIKQATAPTLQGPWTDQLKYLDAYHGTSTHVEGSSIFKLNNSEEYILMYDLYSSNRYEFQRSKDLYEFSNNPESFTKNFHPRHGSVLNITTAEARKLSKKWGGIPKELLK